MDKYQFLEILSKELMEDLQTSEAQYQINYYRNYIEEQIASGRSETEIMDELGDPRLIARTVIDGERDAGAWVRGDEGVTSTYNDRRKYDGRRSTNSVYEESDDKMSQEPDLKTKLKFYGITALVLVVIFIILAIVFRLFVLFLPAIICIAVISWIFKQLS